MVGDDVQIAIGVGLVVVGGWRQDPIAQCQGGGEALQGGDVPSAWPCIDLVELTASFWACGPKTERMAAVSVGSLAGVAVPWALM